MKRTENVFVCSKWRKENPSMPGKKGDNAKLRIVFSAMLFAVVFIVELYAMINLSQQYIVVGLLGLLLLVCLYILVSAIIADAAKKQEKQEEQYSNILTAEKASYLMTKKYFEEISRKLTLVEQGTKVPTDELIGTQKGIGKVVINRSRENAEAIINSNDQVLESIKHLESLMEVGDSQTADSMENSADASIRQMLENQQELITDLKAMEQRLNDTIVQNQNVFADMAAVPEVQEEPAAAAVPEVHAEPGAEKKPPVPDTSDPNKVMSPDDIAALFAAMG